MAPMKIKSEPRPSGRGWGGLIASTAPSRPRLGAAFSWPVAPPPHGMGNSSENPPYQGGKSAVGAGGCLCRSCPEHILQRHPPRDLSRDRCPPSKGEYFHSR